MGFTINFNVGVQKVVQFQLGSDKDDGDQEKKKDEKPETVVEDNNGEEEKKNGKKTVSTAEDNGEKKKEKKTVSTAVFAVHCLRCIQKVCKVLAKTKGIRDTVIDVEDNHVTVKGEMDVKALADYLGRKLKKEVVIVQVNENGGGAGEGEMDMKALADYLGRKLKKAVVIVQVNENGGGAGEEEKEGDKNGASALGPCPYGSPYLKGYPNLCPNGYGLDYLAATEQMFSDENPNACFVM